MLFASLITRTYNHIINKIRVVYDRYDMLDTSEINELMTNNDVVYAIKLISNIMPIRSRYCENGMLDNVDRNCEILVDL